MVGFQLSFAETDIALFKLEDFNTPPYRPFSSQYFVRLVSDDLHNHNILMLINPRVHPRRILPQHLLVR